jgi:putative CocE/NonD family hydrolase
MSHGFPYSAGDEQEAKPAHSAEDIGLLWGLRIPMRDGVRLGATVYKPTVDMPVPAIFTLTPYIADSYHERAIYFSQRGYAFVLVDCRGRGNSEGAFEPFVNEEQDGHDVVLWLGDQPWCNGSVAMWGGSYAGFNQWMTLKAAPRQLKTIVPVAAAHAAVDFPFFKNLFSSYEMRWLTLTSGSTGNSNLFGEEAFWIAKYREMYLKNRPFSELDRIVGNLTTHFQTWLQHPTPDPYWDRMSLAPADYDAIKVPILTITGHYDGDQTGALHYYNRHMQSSSTARDCHFVIIGPWDHAGTRTPKVEFGGLTFGQASLVDMNQLHRAWYD